MSGSAVPNAEFWRGRRVLVTGGTGFLGRQFVGRLEEMGAEVSSCSRREGVDLRSLDEATAVMMKRRPDTVIHLAANTGGIEYQQAAPATVVQDNTLIVLNTIEAARVAEVDHYVNIVAACAYPDKPPESGLLSESGLNAGPMHPTVEGYGQTRRLSVTAARMYRRQFGMPVTSIIFTNAYGPGDHFENDRSHALAALVRRFMEAKDSGAPAVSVWGTGRAERDWLYRDDAVEGTLIAVERSPDADLLNVGTGLATTTAELAETVRDAVGYEGEIEYDTTKPEGTLRKILDTTEMKRHLDWAPPTSLREGVDRTFEWLRKHYDEAVSRG